MYGFPVLPQIVPGAPFPLVTLIPSTSMKMPVAEGELVGADIALAATSLGHHLFGPDSPAVGMFEAVPKFQSS